MYYKLEQFENITIESIPNTIPNIPTMSYNNLDISSLQITVEKLNGKKYTELSQSIKLVINGRGKTGHLMGETRKPALIVTGATQRWSSDN